MWNNFDKKRTLCFLRRWKPMLAVTAALVLVVLPVSLAAFGVDCAAVRQDTLRLHIRANSDTAADQANKLAVRDAVLAAFGTSMAGAKNKAQAMALVRQNREAIQKTAEETLQAHGCNDAVHVSLVNMAFDTIRYEDFTMPAGNYDALRIDIGVAAGHNWFCVMYPPLCLSAASDDAFCLYTQAEQRAVSSRYTLRFAALEWWQNTVQKNGENVAAEKTK